MRLAYNILLFYICANLASFIMLQSEMLPINISLGWQPISQTDNVLLDLFNINAFSVLLGIGGSIAIGIVGFLLRQGINAVYALIVFVVGVLFTPVSQFITSLPIVLATVIPADSTYLISVILSIVSFAFFFFFIELVTQQRLT